MPIKQRPPTEDDFRRRFDTELPHMMERAKKVQRLPIMPGHWFSAAASECAEMYVRGYFYGAISVGQAYVEALGLYLADANHTRRQSGPKEMWEKLEHEGIVSTGARDAAHEILADRNDYHHLNKTIETGYLALQSRAETVVNSIHVIDLDVFDSSVSETPGAIAPAKPQYWPKGEHEGTSQVFVRSVW